MIFLSKGGTTKSFVLTQRHPLEGRRAAAVLKEAVEILAPNLGKPRESRGGCALPPERRQALELLGHADEIAELEAKLRAQGGDRSALFEADGHRITVMLADADEKNEPGIAIIRWTDAEVWTDFPVVPWEGMTLCD